MADSNNSGCDAAVAGAHNNNNNNNNEEEFLPDTVAGSSAIKAPVPRKRVVKIGTSSQLLQEELGFPKESSKRKDDAADPAGDGSPEGFLDSGTVDPFMTVIYPNTGTEKDEDGLDDDEEADIANRVVSRRDGDNFDRTQVRVGGFLQGADDNMAFLIPNDLPRSTFLYLLTASDGRDRLFKCMQCSLHLLICLLMRPSILPQGSEETADYWAERFRKNINTIRHGRSLFKLGRWIVNAFYLQEVYERLALKYGRTMREVKGEFKAFLCRYLSLPPGSVMRRLIGWDNNGVGGGSTGQFVNREVLVPGDTYEHVARVEFPRQFVSELHSIDAKLVTTGPSLTGIQQKEVGVSGAIKASDMALQSEEAKEDGDRKVAGFSTLSEGKGLMVRDPLRTEALTSGSLAPSATPPSLYPAATEMYAVGIGNTTRASLSKPATLLRPLRCTGADDESSNSNNTSIAHNNNTAPSSICGGSLNYSLMHEGKPKGDTYNEGFSTSRNPDDSHQSYFKMYQTVPYEPKLGDALRLPHQGEGDSMNKMSKNQPSRAKFARCGSAVDNGDDIGAEENMFSLGAAFDEGDNHLESNGTVSPSDDREEERERGLAAEIGKPASRRKGILQFSTPLILLQAVRSIATIARRLLRDLLLLSSEHFLNLSPVEQNRALLQRHCHWLWLIVASIDVLLNTIRLLNPGWYKYTNVRDNPRFRCGCKDPDTRGSVMLFRELVIRRQANLYFPDVDLDFGVPICSSPGYFEAADPENIAPACRVCGKLFVEMTSPDEQGEKLEQGGDDTTAEEKGVTDTEEVETNGNAAVRQKASKSITGRAEVVFLFIPWLMRRLFNYIWLVRSHSNWSATIWLQVSYLAEFYLAVMYCFGGYDTGKRDAPLKAMIHPTGAIVGFVGAIIGVYRVIQSAPK